MSERERLRIADGADPYRERSNLIAQLGAIALAIAVIASVLLRGWR